MGKPRGRGERKRTRQAGCSLRFNDSTLYRFNVLTFSVSVFSFQSDFRPLHWALDVGR